MKTPAPLEKRKWTAPGTALLRVLIPALLVTATGPAAARPLPPADAPTHEAVSPRSRVDLSGVGSRQILPRDNAEDPHYRQGVAYLQEHQYAWAAEQFSAVLAQQPDNLPALLCRAVAYYNLGSTGNMAALDRALTDTDTLLKSSPRSATVILLRADILFVRKRFADAGADYAKALDLSPRDPQYAVSQMVASYVNARDYPNVVAATTRAIALQPEEAVNYHLRAIAALHLQQYTSAIADLVYYTHRKSDDPMGFFNLGIAYLEAREPANAVEALEKAANLDPDYYDASWQAANQLKKQADSHKEADPTRASGEYDRAIALYDRAFHSTKASTSQKADALYNKAVALEARAVAHDSDTAVYQQALTVWNQYLALPTNDPDLPRIKDHIARLKTVIAR